MKNIIGNRLKVLRKNKGFSQKQVAENLQVSLSAYIRMENGTSHSWAHHILKICEFFERTPNELIINEIKTSFSSDLRDQEQLTEIAMLSVYRKIIKHYEIQIEELKTIIKHLNKNMN